MALVQSVPDDEIDAEFAAALSCDDHDLRDSIEQRARLAAVASIPTAATAATTGTGTGTATGTATGKVDHPSRPLRPLERRRPGDPRDRREATERVRPAALAHEHTLPLSPVFAELLPAGLPRGSTISIGSHPSEATMISSSAGEHAVGAVGSTSLAMALVSSATQAGSWAALVGLPALGLGAAAELGLALERVAVVDMPRRDSWATVVGALVGAFDFVLFAAPARDSAVPVKAGDLRRLMARARERGSVLIQIDTAAASRAGVGAADRGRRSSWSAFEADLRLRVTGAQWIGLGQGHGHVRARQVHVEASGRRSASRPRRADLWLLDPAGQLAVVRVDELIRSDGSLTHASGVPAHAWADIDSDIDAMVPGPLSAEPVWSDAG